MAIQVFLAFLEDSFSDRPGESWIRRGLYQLSNFRNNTIITPENWSRLVAPGSHINMTMLLDRYLARFPKSYEQCPVASCLGKIEKLGLATSKWFDFCFFESPKAPLGGDNLITVLSSVCEIDVHISDIPSSGTGIDPVKSNGGPLQLEDDLLVQNTTGLVRPPAVTADAKSNHDQVMISTPLTLYISNVLIGSAWATIR